MNSVSRSSTFRDLSVVSFGDVTSKLFSIGTIILLIRGLSINDYATYIAFEAVAIFLSGLIGGGFNVGLVRFSTEYRTKYHKKPTEIYFVIFLLELAVYIGFLLIGILFQEKLSLFILGRSDLARATGLGLWYGLGLLISEYGRSVYQSEEKFSGFVAVLLLRQSIIFFIVLLFFLKGRMDWEPIAVSLAVINLIFGMIIAMRSFKIGDINDIKNLMFSHEKIDLYQFISSTGWLIGYFTLISIFSKLDVFILSHFRSQGELAVYAVAYKFYSLGLLFLGSIHSVLLPKFSRIDMQDVEKQLDFLKVWVRYSKWVIIPVMVFDLFGKNLFVLVNGQEYHQAFSIFILFSLGICVSIILSPLVNIIIARKNFRFLFKIGFIALIFNLISNLFLIRIYGGMGAALTTIVSHMIISGLILLRILLRYKNINQDQN